MVKILAFDTETSGLPPKLGENWTQKDILEKQLQTNANSWTIELLDTWASIIQLGYILYDTENTENIKIFDKYISIPDNIDIDADSLKIHNISREKIYSSNNSVSISMAIQEFIQDAEQADIIIAHNVKFDRLMIISELMKLTPLNKRDENASVKMMLDNKKFVCTMDETTTICKIPLKINYIDKLTNKPNSFIKNKAPKLLEAHNYLFEHNNILKDKLHNAINDAIVCLKIYCKYKYNIDICNTNAIIAERIAALL